MWTKYQKVYLRFKLIYKYRRLPSMTMQNYGVNRSFDYIRKQCFYSKYFMKKLILSLAVAGSMILATSACNSTKNVSGSSDSTSTDSTTTSTPTTGSSTTTDTTRTTTDTTRTTPPDTTKRPPM
jgi:hypothetical protein